MEVSIDHADIVVTHKCTFNCKYYIDAFRNSYNAILSLEDISKFLNVLKLNTKYVETRGGIEKIYNNGDESFILNSIED